MSALRALRQLTAVSRPALRAAAAPRVVLARAAPLSRVLPATRAFSVTARARGDGSSDLALSHKLAEEIKYEKEAAQDAEPDFLKAFKSQGIWTIEGSTGHDEVTLTRKFGSESVRLMFSIADISSGQQDENFGMEGEENEVPESEEEPVDSYPIRCSFSVTKSTGEGALTVDAMCQDGAFVIDNVSFYPTAALGTELTAEADWKRRGMYIGPQFDTLDVGVQEEIEKYLSERGMNESLALFIPEFAEFKEQKEYVRWLESVKKFVDQ